VLSGMLGPPGSTPHDGPGHVCICEIHLSLDVLCIAKGLFGGGAGG
jgi:hypothetical protein